jgi:hypothetical protein
MYSISKSISRDHSEASPPMSWIQITIFCVRGAAFSHEYPHILGNNNTNDNAWSGTLHNALTPDSARQSAHWVRPQLSSTCQRLALK